VYPTCSVQATWSFQQLYQLSPLGNIHYYDNQSYLSKVQNTLVAHCQDSVSCFISYRLVLSDCYCEKVRTWKSTIYLQIILNTLRITHILSVSKISDCNMWNIFLLIKSNYHLVNSWHKFYVPGFNSKRNLYIFPYQHS
jgi:hypothetical protein